MRGAAIILGAPSRFIVGLVLAIAIVVLLPIVDILEMFLYVVLVPVLLLVAIGLVSESTYEMIKSSPKILADLKERVNHHRATLDAAVVPTP